MGNMLKVKLVLADNQEKISEIFDMMTEDNGIKDYYEDKLSSIIKSAYSFIIKCDDKTAGFINLLREAEYEKFLFLDIGIKDEYRNRGIATDMIKFIASLPLKDYVFIKSNNQYINKAIIKLGCKKIIEYQNDNIYLLQNEKYEQFITDKEIEKLDIHFNPTNYYNYELERMKRVQVHEDYMHK